MTALKSLDIKNWEEKSSSKTALLERGNVLYLPHLSFEVKAEEKFLYDPTLVDPKRKNISFDPNNDHLGGSLCQGNEAEVLKAMLKRYSEAALLLVNNLFPEYKAHLKYSKTSFRPAEIAGRKVDSIRKDDTRLHVDAFPSNPTQGFRILRVFTNVNPDGKARVWKVGEPFEEVAKKFVCSIAKPLPFSAEVLKLLKITKNVRSPYDHYMLGIHNKMKESRQYQAEVAQEEIHFPPGSTWLVFTDQVSHAALSGQHVFEQTFFIPASALQNPEHAPVGILENLLRRKLI